MSNRFSGILIAWVASVSVEFCAFLAIWTRGIWNEREKTEEWGKGEIFSRLPPLSSSVFFSFSPQYLRGKKGRKRHKTSLQCLLRRLTCWWNPVVVWRGFSIALEPLTTSHCPAQRHSRQCFNSDRHRSLHNLKFPWTKIYFLML